MMICGFRWFCTTLSVQTPKPALLLHLATRAIAVDTAKKCKLYCT